jgi:hypothetical protein
MKQKTWKKVHLFISDLIHKLSTVGYYRWWSDKGGRTWKEFCSSSALLNYSEKVKKIKVFFMLLPTFGTLANPHL